MCDDGFNPDLLMSMDFSEILFLNLACCLSHFLTGWPSVGDILWLSSTLQMATLFLLPLVISEDWNVLWEIAYTRHKMEAEDKMEELWFFSGEVCF